MPDERTEDAQRPQLNPRRQNGHPVRMAVRCNRDGGIRPVRRAGPAPGDARRGERAQRAQPATPERPPFSDGRSVQSGRRDSNPRPPEPHSVMGHFCRVWSRSLLCCYALSSNGLGYQASSLPFGCVHPSSAELAHNWHTKTDAQTLNSTSDCQSYRPATGARECFPEPLAMLAPLRILPQPLHWSAPLGPRNGRPPLTARSTAGRCLTGGCGKRRSGQPPATGLRWVRPMPPPDRRPARHSLSSTGNLWRREEAGGSLTGSAICAGGLASHNRETWLGLRDNAVLLRGNCLGWCGLKWPIVGKCELGLPPFLTDLAPECRGKLVATCSCGATHPSPFGH